MKNIADVSREADVSMLRLIFGSVPVVGPVLNEVIFDIRGRIKQERLNRFTQMLAEYFIGNPDFDTSILRAEDFSDLLESVLKRVIQTKSESKHKRYRNVLITQIERNFSEIDNSERYLDLISTLNEVEIFILFSHQVFDEGFLLEKEELRSFKRDRESLNLQLKEEVKLSTEGSANDQPKVQADLSEVNKKIKLLEIKLEGFKIYEEASFYSITHNQFNYYKQNLYSKALLVDIGTGTYGHAPFANMGITEFGREFLQFLTADNKV
jgi:hypothetical protein